MVTLKDIALAVGVSVSTVSYVLNGKGKTRPETAQLIRDTAQRLGYVPNASAVMLRTQKSKAIGVLLPQFTTFFFVNVINAIENVLYQNGYNMLLSTSHNNLNRELSGMQNLMSSHIAGLMVVATDRFYEPIPKNLNIPVLRMYESVNEDDVCISVSNSIGGRLAGEHLLNRNLFPVACIGRNPYSHTIVERVTAFRKVMAEGGHPVNKKLIISLDEQTFEGGYRGTLQLLEQGIPFRSIFACTDNIALGALRALNEKGYKVPQDIAIIGYDNTLVSEMTYPSLSTIDMRANDLGKQATRMMLNLIEEKPMVERRLLLVPQLVTREST